MTQVKRHETPATVRQNSRITVRHQPLHVAYKKVRLKSVNMSAIVLCALLSATLSITAVRAAVESRPAVNHPPKFLLDGHQSEIVLRLKEGAETPVGSLIYTLHGSDPDNDPLTFGIRSTPYDSDNVLRIENAANGVAYLYLNRELDRETRDEYLLVLTLTDQRLGDGNFVTQSLLLLVEDINDNEPVFRPYQSTLEVAEDSPPGVLTQLEATDADEGAYGQVVYYLQELDGDNGVFTVSTQQGRATVRLAGQLDYERKNLYQLRVLAVDRANQGPVHTATASLLVKVRDVEDQPPQFAAINPVQRIAEDTPVGAAVVTVRAYDGDRGVNQPIRYAIARGADNSFGINAKTGVVYTTRLLDREDARNREENGAYILEIVATEKSKLVPAPSTSTEITIILMDINDETPRFRRDTYEAEISESSQENTPLTFLGDTPRNAVYDHDQGMNGTFELHLEPDDGLFDITPRRAVNEATFLVRLRQNGVLDYERVRQLNYTLVARESVASGAKWSSVPLVIYVRDSNDNFPEFEQPLYEFAVPENSVAGTVIGRVQASDADAGVFGTNGLRYTHLSGSIAHLLQLDAQTGTITIRSPGDTEFDRETIGSHHLAIEARDNLGQGNRNTVPLIVTLIDVNDNAPVFLDRQYEATLFENKAHLEQPLIVRAKDADQAGTPNADVTYSLIGSSPHRRNFTIHERTGMLSVMRPLDFEALVAARPAGASVGVAAAAAIQPIHLTVVASDRGKPPLSAQAAVVIYLHDVNDHAPQFRLAHYAVAVREDLAGGSTVIGVAASDRDASAPNNAIVYRIQRGAADKFVIGADTGVISVAHGSSLDPDLTVPKTQQYTLVVLALDGGLGEHQKLASTLVNITIMDVNNKGPVIAEPERVTMLENTPTGTEVYRMVASDLDADARLQFSLQPQLSEARSEEGVLIRPSNASGNGSGGSDFVDAFAIDPLSGIVSVRRPVDRERIEQIRLAVAVEDLAAVAGRQTATAYLTIVVEDVNDNNPHFRRPFYTRTLTENSAIGTAVLHAAAYDVDKNRTIAYELDGPSSAVDLLHIDAETGEMVVAQRIDHEVVQWLNCTVRATDSGVPPRSAMVDVYVRIADENDNNPYFVAGEPAANLSVAENSPIGTRIAMIKATDADSGDFGKITFLMDKMSSQGKFSVDADTGVLSVADALDRESRGGYAVVVEAWDNYQFGYLSGESRNAFKQFYIEILDENDSPPVLHYATGVVQISEYHDLADQVTQIRATDADDASTGNGRVEFRLTGGTGRDLFRLVQRDAWNCVLFAKRSLHDYYGNYTVLVEARDLGEPPNRVMAEINVAVLDFNDHAPYFVAPGTNVTLRVAENATIGTPIVRVHARDDDVGPNAAILYRFKPDSLGNYRTFAIDPASGQITLRLPLDREHQKIYDVRIEAYDQGMPPLTTDLDLTVYVRNVNDYEPQFLVDEIAVNFTEHALPGVERVKLPDTVDRDEVDELDDPPSQVCYFIVYGNADGQFALDARTHVLTVVRELDRELSANHTLVVKATENCDAVPEALSLRRLADQAAAQQLQNRLSYPSAVMAPLQQRQSNRDVVQEYNRYKHSRSLRSLSAMLGGVYEEATAETPLPTLSFEESLHGGDGQLAMREQAEEPLMSERRLLSDALEEDGTLVRIHVRVLDINDNPPQFASTVFTGGLTTTTDFGTAIMQLNAVDPDADANALVRYYQTGAIHRTLTEGLDQLQRAPFLVDAVSGAILLNFDPQPGMKGYFDFNVLANDTAGQSDRAHVFIYLLRDDQRVRFVLRQQPGDVRERIDVFREALANVTQAIVNVDDFKVHENRDGSVDKTKTDLYMHLVDRRDNSILEVAEVLQLIDQNIEVLDGLFKDFNVLDTQPSEALQLVGAAANGPLVLWLVFANIFVGTLLVVVMSLCFSQRKSYRRQLRAACVHSYVTSPSEINIRTGNADVVPNTNKHSMQGSNPIWMKAYANEWFRSDDDLDTDTNGSHSHRHHRTGVALGGGFDDDDRGGGFDSLDENVLASAEADYRGGGGVAKRSTTLAKEVEIEAGAFIAVGPYNVYQQIDRMMTGNAKALTKKLETTEL